MRRGVPLRPLLGIALLVAAALPGVARAEAVPCDRVIAYVSEACPRCAPARRYLAELRAARPSLGVEVKDVTRDPAARAAWVALARRSGAGPVGTPTFDVCGRMWVGFDEATTPAALDALLRGEDAAGGGAFCGPEPCPGEPVGGATPVEVPIFGRISERELGLPLFTIALGLVDGFNPCAMWVLLFLLSMLVHLHDRRRMALIAGTFVFVSGAAYFAFMAAWLNVFALVGLSRAAQIAVGLAALVIGAVHVKDFFAFEKGPSLSIPESAKPGIYARVRRIVRAESLAPALAGAFVLAVLVNAIELLCTAGIPAIYTHVLAMHALPVAHYYLHLGLYVAAYMLDDAVMVTIAVVTLGHRKLTERGGRGLKLVSGAVLWLLGALLLARPEWLALGR